MSYSFRCTSEKSLITTEPRDHDHGSNTCHAVISQILASFSLENL
jgi:hypothetical protein